MLKYVSKHVSTRFKTLFTRFQKIISIFFLKPCKIVKKLSKNVITIHCQKLKYIAKYYVKNILKKWYIDDIDHNNNKGSFSQSFIKFEGSEK